MHFAFSIIIGSGMKERLVVNAKVVPKERDAYQRT
jgi:hypothetical protein